MATNRLIQFTRNIDRARELVGLGESISDLTVGTVDATDMYRAALVQGVASLDAYVHGVVLDLGVEILHGRRPAGSKTQVGLHFGAVTDLISASNAIEFELRAIAHVAERLSRETFQRPDDIAKAFAMVGVARIWTTAFGAQAVSTMRRLGLIVTRRNQIVHSCDVDPTDPTTLQSLAAADAVSAVETVKEIVLGMDVVL